MQEENKSSAVAEKRRHAECALVYRPLWPRSIYNRMQKLSSRASINVWCNFVTDRCHQIGVHAAVGMTPKTGSIE